MWKAATAAFLNATIDTPVIHFSDRLDFLFLNRKLSNYSTPSSVLTQEVSCFPS